MVELSGIPHYYRLEAVKNSLGLEEPELGVLDPEGGQLNCHRANARKSTPSLGIDRTGAALE